MQETTCTMSSTRNPNASTGKAADHKHKKTEHSIHSNSSSTTEVKVVENGSVENGRERLKRHRVEVAGRVWIPEMWGQEGLLKDWIDCTAFDATLMNSSIMSARAAMMEEAAAAGRRRRRTSANPTAVPHLLRLENSC